MGTAEVQSHFFHCFTLLVSIIRAILCQGDSLGIIWTWLDQAMVHAFCVSQVSWIGQFGMERIMGFLLQCRVCPHTALPEVCTSGLEGIDSLHDVVIISLYAIVPFVFVPQELRRKGDCQGNGFFIESKVMLCTILNQPPYQCLFFLFGQIPTHLWNNMMRFPLILRKGYQEPIILREIIWIFEGNKGLAKASLLHILWALDPICGWEHGKQVFIVRQSISGKWPMD